MKERDIFYTLSKDLNQEKLKKKNEMSGNKCDVSKFLEISLLKIIV